MKKMKLLLCALLILVMCGCAKTTGTMENVTIRLKIEDATAKEILFEGEVSSEGVDQTLADVLLANKDVLQLLSDKTSFGLQIHGLMGVETADWDKGPWWVYTSENNASCLKAGYCTGASELKVATGDVFAFTFSYGY